MKVLAQKLLTTTLASFALSVLPQASAAVLISESFGGSSGGNLTGTFADTFAGAITSAGGSDTWVANTVFKADGSTSTTQGQGRSAYLNLGSFINNAKGASNGIFTLQATLAQPVQGTGTGASNFVTLGFAAESAPNTARAFNDLSASSGSTSTTGVGTMIYRANGDIDQFGGPGSTNQVALDDTFESGIRTLTLTLDLTPLNGYNGTNNFGTMFFGADTGVGNAYEQYGSWTFTSNTNFNSLLLSIYSGNSNGTTTGDFTSLSLSQIPEPGAALLGSLGLLALMRRRR